MNNTNLEKSWLNYSEYPFRHRFIPLSEGNMHYVDEGCGETLLFVHGTPTWSFLYRKFIKKLSLTFRTVAIDHIGFGLSEKPNDFKSRPRDHARNLSYFIKKMDLRDITIVVHDFGGPIGLSTAIQCPDRIKRIVLFNSWLWETESNSEAVKADRIINSFLGRFLYLRMNFSPRVLLKKAFSDRGLLTNEIHRHYLEPFPNKQSRRGLYRMAQSLVGESDWYQKQWDQLSVLQEKSWLILWGMEDPFFNTGYLDKWKTRLPHAQIHEFQSGHFIQEEQPKAAIEAMQDFLH